MGTKHVEHHYNIPRLNAVFAASSVALLLSIVGLFWYDYRRPWKGYQREFAALDLERTEQEIESILSEAEVAELEALETQLAEAKAKLQQRASDPEFVAAKKKVGDLEAQQYLLDSQARKIKSVIDSRRFYYEETLKDDPASARPLKDELDKLSADREQALDLLKATDEEVKAATSVVAGYTQEQDETTAKIGEITKLRDLLLKKKRSLEPSLTNDLRNAVVLDMLQPTVKPKQIVTDRILDDWVFEKANKVDRCTSCHLGIDKENYSDAPQPFRAHPNLALILSSKSPHKLDDVGCTVCHQGRGWAMDFVRATHSPDDEVEREEWEERYGWFHDHWWESHMFPKSYSEAGCYVCHQEQVQLGSYPARTASGTWNEKAVPAAPLLDEGLKLVYEYGCTGCHKIASLSDPEGIDPGLRDFRKIGPDLRHLRAKADERFVNKWLQNPKHFRPTTRMPRIFGLENHDTPELKAREQVELNSVAYLLLSRSQPVEMDRPSGPGDVEKGRSLFRSVGCLACHVTAGQEPQPGKEAFKATFAPDLSAIGSKVSYEWIYGWILNPTHYFPETRMPSLRLSEEEARNVAAYLATLRNEEFEREPAVSFDPVVLDQVTREYLLTTLTVQEAEQQVASMSTESKKLLVGEKILNRYGCHGCHLISGFEEAKQIGTELTEEGSKDVERLDFGFLQEEPPHLEATNYAWFFQKLKAPRSFDRGKDRLPEDLLKMPQYEFSDEQARAITTVLLSLRKTDSIPFTSRKHLTVREKAIERGHRVLLRHNCQGCHDIEGKGGETIQAYLPQGSGVGSAPPPIDGAGKKLQTPWLFGFLKSPTTLRPRVMARMPTFQFTDAEANAIIEFLAAIWNEPYPFDSVTAGTLGPEDQEIAKEMFTVAKCQSCHVTSDTQQPGPDVTAPNLLLAKVRLKPRWVIDWLKDPESLQPGTNMPQFWSEGRPISLLKKYYPDHPTALDKRDQGTAQIEALRDYVYMLKEEEPPRAHE